MSETQMFIPGATAAQMLVGLPTLIMNFTDLPDPLLESTFAYMRNYLEAYADHTCGLISSPKLQAETRLALLCSINAIAFPVAYALKSPTRLQSNAVANGAARLALYDIIAQIDSVVMETGIADETYA